MNPEQFYKRGKGIFPHKVELIRLWEPTPLVIYRGIVQIKVETLDRVKQKKQVKGYHNEDFWIVAKNKEWPEMSRRDYQGNYDYDGNKGVDCYAIEDYEIRFLPEITKEP